jgi:hypothetical protein
MIRGKPHGRACATIIGALIALVIGNCRMAARLALEHCLPFWSIVSKVMEIAESVVVREAKTKALSW